jgi:hypothetical protein
MTLPISIRERGVSVRLSEGCSATDLARLAPHDDFFSVMSVPRLILMKRSHG